MKKCPGVMIYFEIREALKRLNDEQKGQMFDAILLYADEGIETEFNDGALDMAWLFIKGRVDCDRSKYGLKVMKSRYAVYCREVAKRKDEIPMSFDEWSQWEGRGNDRKT